MPLGPARAPGQRERSNLGGALALPPLPLAAQRRKRATAGTATKTTARSRLRARDALETRRSRDPGPNSPGVVGAPNCPLAGETAVALARKVA